MELPVDRRLINHRFNSYRLSVNVPWKLDECPLPEPVQTLELDQNDYGYVHASMLSNINGLFRDDSSGRVYFITKSGLIMGLKLASGQRLQEVYRIPDYHSSNTYASLAFVSQFRMLILRSKRLSTTDLVLDLLILDRSDEDAWKIDSIFPLSETTKTPFSRPSSHFYLFNSGTESLETTNISFVFGSVHEITKDRYQKPADGLKKPFQSRFQAILEWITVQKSNDRWSMLHHRRLCDSGLKSDWPKYVAILDHQRIVVASEGRMVFKQIIENGSEPIEALNAENPEIKPLDLELVEEARTKEDGEFSNFQELEECDMQDSLLLMSVFGGDSRLLKEFDLSSQQWLCTVPNTENPRVPCFVIRHDVDAFIYRLDDLEARHIATFDALGYIQASKTKKRFMTLKMPRYAIIGDADTNIFLYWNMGDADQEQGNHAIVQLGPNDPIQGLSPGAQAGSICHVLTNRKLTWISEQDSNQLSTVK